MIAQVSFFALALTTIILSLVMLTRKLPVTAAMLLIVIMILLAGMYGLLGAHFSAVSQIIVYAGAIMVVFVFVIMLLNMPDKDIRLASLTPMEILFCLFGLVVVLFFGTKVGQGHLSTLFLPASQINARPPYYPEVMDENVKNVSALMFTDYLWAFELISFLILTAVIGAIVISKKERTHS